MYVRPAYSPVAAHHSLIKGLGSPNRHAHGNVLRRRRTPYLHQPRRAGIPPSLPEQLVSILGPSPEDQREFDTLWSEFARELELSKETSNAIAQQARQGNLVCNALFLRARTLKFLAVCGKVPGLNPRSVLSQSSLTLRYPPHQLAASARRLLVLLPDHDITSTLVTVMAHLDLGPDILASQLLELEAAVCPCFYGAAVPPLLFAFYVSEQLDLEAQAQSAPLNSPAAGLPSSDCGGIGHELGEVNSTGQVATSSWGSSEAPLTCGQGGDAQSSGRLFGNAIPSSTSSSASAGSGTGWDSSREQGWRMGTLINPSSASIWPGSLAEDGSMPAGSLTGGRVTKGRLMERAQRADAGLDLGMEGDEDEDEDGRPIEGGARLPGGQALDLPEMLVRVRALVSVLGAEVAYVGLSRTPRIMLSVGGQKAQANLAALQEVLRIDAASAARMVESRGRLASMDPAELQPQLSALTIALGWPRSRARLLCIEEPLALLRTPSSIGKLWRRLQRTGKLQRAWFDALNAAPVEFLAMLIRLPRPDEALARMDFLAKAAGIGKWTKVPDLERILRTPIGAFIREFPEYNSRIP